MSIESSILKFYFESDLLQSAYDAIKKKILSLNADQKQFTDQVILLNNSIFNTLVDFPISNLFVSITSTNSLFYRFIDKKNINEFKLEVFFDDQNEDTDSETILHFYKLGIKNNSYFGSMDEILKIISSILLPDSNNFYEYNIKRSEIIFEQRTPELAISYSLNSEKELLHNF